MKYLGFIPPIIDSSHFVLGAFLSLSKDILQHDGQWDSYLPVSEEQNKNGMETYNCTSFNTLNTIEILFNKIWAEKDNYSDRFTGIEAGTRPPGNDPHAVAEAIRLKGAIPEISLPFSDSILSWTDYYSFVGSDENECMIMAKRFLDQYDFGHEWVFTNAPTKETRIMLMKEALQYSPLGASVTAWYGVDGIYVDNGEPNCHWTCIYGYDDRGWKCFDSYSPFYKIISYDHNIQFVKRYSIKKKITVKLSWWRRLLNFLHFI